MNLFEYITLINLAGWTSLTLYLMLTHHRVSDISTMVSDISTMVSDISTMVSDTYVYQRYVKLFGTDSKLSPQDTSPGTEANPKLIFTDASTTHHLGHKNYKPFATGMFMLFDEEEREYSNKHMNTELKQYTENNSLDETHNLNLMECQGILDVINHTDIKTSDHIVIYTDSETSMKIFHGALKSKMAKKKYRNMKLALNQAANHKNLTVNVRWIKAHVGIFGNTQADRLAKTANNESIKSLGIC